MSVFRAERYCKLLEKIVPDLGKNYDVSSSGLVSDDQSDLDVEPFGDDGQYVVQKKLADKKSRYNELHKEIALRGDKCLMKELNSVIGNGLNGLSSVLTKLTYLNQNFKNIDRHSLALHSKQMLSIEKSSQKELVEVIRILANFCNSFDENLQFLSDENLIDWETLIKRMMEVVAGDRVALARIDCLFDDLKRLSSSVNIIFNQIENSKGNLNNEDSENL